MLTSVHWSEIAAGIIIGFTAGANVGLGDHAAIGWIIALILYFSLLHTDGQRTEATRQLGLARRVLLALKAEVEVERDTIRHVSPPVGFYRRADR
jgi:hypothetical protein